VHLTHQQVHDAVEGGWVGLSQTAQQTLVCGNSSSSSDSEDSRVVSKAEGCVMRAVVMAGCDSQAVQHVLLAVCHNTHKESCSYCNMSSAEHHRHQHPMLFSTAYHAVLCFDQAEQLRLRRRSMERRRNKAYS
jgi:hypothetical protein